MTVKKFNNYLTSFELTSPLRKQPSKFLMLLVRLQKNIDNFFKKTL